MVHDPMTYNQYTPMHTSNFNQLVCCNICSLPCRLVGFNIRSYNCDVRVESFPAMRAAFSSSPPLRRNPVIPVSAMHRPVVRISVGAYVVAPTVAVSQYQNAGSKFTLCWSSASSPSESLTAANRLPATIRAPISSSLIAPPPVATTVPLRLSFLPLE